MHSNKHVDGLDRVSSCCSLVPIALNRFELTGVLANFPKLESIRAKSYWVYWYLKRFGMSGMVPYLSTIFLNKRVGMLQSTVNAFSWMNTMIFCLTFHWSSFLWSIDRQWVSISSDNSSRASGNNPLPGPMLTEIFDALFRIGMTK